VPSVLESRRATRWGLMVSPHPPDKISCQRVLRHVTHRYSAAATERSQCVVHESEGVSVCDRVYAACHFPHVYFAGIRLMRMRAIAQLVAAYPCAGLLSTGTLAHECECVFRWVYLYANKRSDTLAHSSSVHCTVFIAVLYV